MNLNKIILYSLAILAVLCVTYFLYQREQDEKKLRIEGNDIVYAKILELSCGRRDFIRFQYMGQEIGQRIYLTDSECNELKGKNEVGLKIDTQGNIVFANDSYNDWSEAEMASILMLGAFFIFCIIYYWMLPEIKKSRNEN